MLNYNEFMDKKRIVMVKSEYTYVFSHNDGWLKICSIPIKANKCMNVETFYVENKDDLEDAYEFYKERMESFGYKPFTIIME